MASKPQNELTEQTTLAEYDDFWLNMQLAASGEQLQVNAKNIPLQPRASRSAWLFSTSTADTDPGAGQLRFNNTTQNSTTFVYISNTDQSGIDWGSTILSTPTGHIFTVEESSSRYKNFQSTGPAIDGTTYVKIPVVLTTAGSDIRNAAIISVGGVESAGVDTQKVNLLEKLLLRSSATGIISVTTLAVNPNNVSVDVGTFMAQFIKNTGADAENPEGVEVTFPAEVGLASPYLNTNNITVFGIDANGIWQFSADSNFSNSQLRDIAVIGTMVHTNKTTVDRVIFRPISAIGITQSGQDLTRAIQPISVTGNKYSGVSATAEISRSAGALLVLDANFITNPKDPHNLQTFLEDPVEDILYVASDNSNLPCAGVNSTTIPNLWEDSTVTTNPDMVDNLQTIPGNKYVNHLLVSFQEGRTNVQVGQTLHNSMDDALANLRIEVAQVIEDNALKMCWMTVKGGFSDTTDPLECVFTNGGKHGIEVG